MYIYITTQFSLHYGALVSLFLYGVYNNSATYLYSMLYRSSLLFVIRRVGQKYLTYSLAYRTI